MKHKSSLLLIGLAYLGFVSLGLPDGLFGVAWPSIRASFNLPLDALGMLLVMFTIGYLLSSFSSGWLRARFNVGTLLAFSCLATAASLLGYALTMWWWLMVALGMLAGLGAGAIDAGLNTFAATHFSARMVNWLHACYGAGATLGPVIMTGALMGGRSWQWGYAVVGFWQLALAACFGLTRRWWPTTSASEDTLTSVPVRAASGRQTLKLPVAWLSVAVFFIYTGIEAAAGAWAFSLFTGARAIPESTAGMWVSIYWGSFTFGRIVSGLIVSFTSAQRLLRYCIIGIAIGAALLWLNVTSPISFAGLALMGVSCAPVFPSLIASTPVRLGAAHTANGVGFQIAAAVFGQSLLPGLVGVLADELSLEIVGPALLTAAILLLALYEALLAASPRKAPEAEAVV